MGVVKGRCAKCNRIIVADKELQDIFKRQMRIMRSAISGLTVSQLHELNRRSDLKDLIKNSIQSTHGVAWMTGFMICVCQMLAVKRIPEIDVIKVDGERISVSIDPRLIYNSNPELEFD